MLLGRIHTTSYRGLFAPSFMYCLGLIPAYKAHPPPPIYIQSMCSTALVTDDSSSPSVVTGGELWRKRRFWLSSPNCESENRGCNTYSQVNSQHCWPPVPSGQILTPPQHKQGVAGEYPWVWPTPHPAPTEMKGNEKETPYIGFWEEKLLSIKSIKKI